MTVPVFDLQTVPADDRERVASTIPDSRLADAYIHRGATDPQLEGMDEFDLFDVAVEEQENIILAGPTGSAKTSVFRAYAASRQLPFVLVECNAAMDPGVVIGRTTIDSEGGVRYIDGDLTLVVRYGGVALVDEVNMAHPRVTAAWHQLLAVTRRMSIPEAGESIKAGQGGIGAPQPVLFGAAYNPRYQGTVRLNEALSNRFAVPLDWDYDEGVENELLSSSTLLEAAQNMRSLAEIRTPVSTNMLMEFERHAMRLGMGLARRLFINHFPAEERGPVMRAFEATHMTIQRELQHAAELGV